MIYRFGDLKSCVKRRKEREKSSQIDCLCFRVVYSKSLILNQQVLNYPKGNRCALTQRSTLSIPLSAWT